MELGSPQLQVGQQRGCEGAAQQVTLPNACLEYTGHYLIIGGSLLRQQNLPSLSRNHDCGVHMAVSVRHPMPAGRVAMETRMFNPGSLAAKVKMTLASSLRWES